MIDEDTPISQFLEFQIWRRHYMHIWDHIESRISMDHRTGLHFIDRLFAEQ